MQKSTTKYQHINQPSVSGLLFHIGKTIYKILIKETPEIHKFQI